MKFYVINLCSFLFLISEISKKIPINKINAIFEVILIWTFLQNQNYNRVRKSETNFASVTIFYEVKNVLLVKSVAFNSHKSKF